LKPRCLWTFFSLHYSIYGDVPNCAGLQTANSYGRPGPMPNDKLSGSIRPALPRPKATLYDSVSCADSSHVSCVVGQETQINSHKKTKFKFDVGPTSFIWRTTPTEQSKDYHWRFRGSGQRGPCPQDAKCCKWSV